MAVGKMSSVKEAPPLNPLFFAALFGLYLTSLYSYLLFHSLAEIFSVLVAGSIFVIAWNTRHILDGGYLLLLGTAYLFVGIIDITHALTYKGMGVFPGFDSNPATQLWISARYMESLSLLAAPLFIGRKVDAGRAVALYSIVTAVLLLSIFGGVFPDCYIEGVGLTPFKKASEYIICLILLASGMLIVAKRSELDGRVCVFLILSVIVTIASELSFTSYVSVYGLANMVGHLLKVLSFYLLYKAITETGLVKPYGLLFRNMKKSEDELRKARDELEKRVEERTAELAEANAELKAYASKLESLNRELREFAFVASHDLQEPLRKIQVFADLLNRNDGTALSEQGRDFLVRMRKSAGRMRELISVLLDYSRAAEESEPLSVVDLGAIAREAAEDLQMLIESKGATVEISTLPNAEADSVLMRQLFQNLLSNALKYSKEGDHPEVRVYSSPTDEGFCRICVEDNGIGFDEQYLGKIFAPFQRLHGRGGQYTGAGMGLAICRKIVERHQGTITARSAPGRGSTFVVTIPIGRKTIPQ